jgi:carbonic anhydrase
MDHSRRTLFRAALVGAAAAAIAEGTPKSAVLAQTIAGPDAALRELVEGNQRYTGGEISSFETDLDLLRSKTAEQQEPFAAVLSCADSRVPVELIFDQSIGHLFVARVAGNIATAELIASLEYGVAVLGTKAIMVLGHANCGAVKASIEGKAVPGQISALYPYIRPAVDQAGPDLEATIKANAKIQAALLRQSSPVLGDYIKQGRLKIVAGYYDLARGKVTVID